MPPEDTERYKTRLRDNKFASRLKTNIWSELPQDGHPYTAEKCYCHGYDIMELMQKRSFVDVLFLLFQGDLPKPQQEGLLEALMIGLINPGPRHPATRAAINAGIGKTDTAHILPISLLALGGNHLGGNEASASMRFLNKSCRRSPQDVIAELLSKDAPPANGDHHPAPGFGTRFGVTDAFSSRLAQELAGMPGAGRTLDWAMTFCAALEVEGRGSWLTTGVAAATLCDVGFHPRTGAGLYQLLCAPGLLAHGLEMSNKPVTAMPFIDDEHYVFEK